mmetsp:Transcript_11248/g.22276  ORF Transcript_11248/g.22276 Transcript_11248/m.22276 type:complete len:271 (-) Transcript_11248:140-952(-)
MSVSASILSLSACASSFSLRRSFASRFLIASSLASTAWLRLSARRTSPLTALRTGASPLPSISCSMAPSTFAPLSSFSTWASAPSLPSSFPMNAASLALPPPAPAASFPPARPLLLALAWCDEWMTLSTTSMACSLTLFPASFAVFGWLSPRISASTSASSFLMRPARLLPASPPAATLLCSYVSSNPVAAFSPSSNPFGPAGFAAADAPLVWGKGVPSGGALAGRRSMMPEAKALYTTGGGTALSVCFLAASRRSADAKCCLFCCLCTA